MIFKYTYSEFVHLMIPLIELLLIIYKKFDILFILAELVIIQWIMLKNNCLMNYIPRIERQNNMFVNLNLPYINFITPFVLLLFLYIAYKLVFNKKNKICKRITLFLLLLFIQGTQYFPEIWDTNFRYLYIIILLFCFHDITFKVNKVIKNISVFLLYIVLFSLRSTNLVDYLSYEVEVILLLYFIYKNLPL